MEDAAPLPRTPRVRWRAVVPALLATFLVGGVLVVGTGTSAGAAVVTVKDPLRDATSRYDLTRVRMTNSTTVSVKARVKDLRAGGLQAFGFTVTPEGSRRPAYWANSVLRRSGRVEAALRQREGTKKVRLSCPVTARWRPGRNVVTLSFPQHCLAQHGTVVMQARIGPGTGKPREIADRTVPVKVAYREDDPDDGTGTVALTDDAPEGSTLFQVDGLTPDKTGTECIRLTYDGSAQASVRLHAHAAGGLASHLDLTVDQGTGGESGSCDSFSAERTLYTGTLAGFSSRAHDYATALESWLPSGPGQTKTYRFTYRLQDVDAAQGQSASATFTWEAQGTS